MNEWLAIIIGGVIGFLIQAGLSMLIANGEWSKISNRRKLGMYVSGAMSALMAGLILLSFTPFDPHDTTNLARLFLAQAGAAVTGAEFIRLVSGIATRQLAAIVSKDSDNNNGQ